MHNAYVSVCTLSGAPTKAGTFSFTVLLTDTLGTAGALSEQKTYNVSVQLAANASVLPTVGAPNTGFSSDPFLRPLSALVLGTAIIGMAGVRLKSAGHGKNKQS